MYFVCIHFLYVTMISGTRTLTSTLKSVISVEIKNVKRKETEVRFEVDWTQVKMILFGLEPRTLRLRNYRNGQKTTTK